MPDDQPKPISLGIENKGSSWTPWIVSSAIAVALLILVFLMVTAPADGNNQSELLNQVTAGPRSGIVADNLGDEVCMFLIREDGTAETRKSCIPREQALNLGQTHEEVPSVALAQGSGLFRVTRDTRFGVSDGVIFEPINSLPPVPTPTAKAPEPKDDK